MKLTLQQLPQHLQQALAAIYIVSGDETLLVQETVDSIRKTAFQNGFKERLRIPTDSNLDWSQLLQTHAQSRSLFSEKKLLELDLTTIKLNASSSKLLQDYVTAPPSDTILLITTHKLDTKAEQSSWYKTLDKASMIISIWPVNAEQLPGWILQRSKQLHLSLTPNAALLLATQVEGNLLAAAQELEKLALLQLTETIDEDTIRQSGTDCAHFDIFALVESALAGNHPRSLRILATLFAEGTEPVLILWALTREIRTLIEIIQETQKGVSLSALFTKWRIWDKRQPAVRAFLKRHTRKTCYALLIAAADIDRMIKGAEMGNVKEALERLLLEM